MVAVYAQVFIRILYAYTPFQVPMGFSDCVHCFFKPHTDNLLRRMAAIAASRESFNLTGFEYGKSPLYSRMTASNLNALKADGCSRQPCFFMYLKYAARLCLYGNSAQAITFHWMLPSQVIFLPCRLDLHHVAS